MNAKFSHFCLMTSGLDFCAFTANSVSALVNDEITWIGLYHWELNNLFLTCGQVLQNKLSQVRQWGLTYIHTCWSCVHMQHFTNGASLPWRLRWRISTVMFTCGWAWPARWPICPIFGFLGTKVHKNVRFPALDTYELPSKIWRR